jgi:hypothetical protein
MEKSMKLVSMLIAAFGIMFSASVFSMEVPIYGFVDSPQFIAQPALSTEGQTLRADESIIIDEKQSPTIEQMRISKWEAPAGSFVADTLVTLAELPYEVGWQVKHTAIYTAI